MRGALAGDGVGEFDMDVEGRRTGTGRACAVCGELERSEMCVWGGEAEAEVEGEETEEPAAVCAV